MLCLVAWNPCVVIFPHSLGYAGTYDLTQYCTGAEEQGVDFGTQALYLWGSCLS